MDLICDTNVWYDIGSGRRNPTVLKKNGNRLVGTPTSFFEIASLIGNHNFLERRAAAQAVIDYADYVIEDSETHLVRKIGFAPQTYPVDWIHGFTAIAQAATPDNLPTGVYDFTDRVIRKVDLPLVRNWRAYQFGDFEAKVIDAIDSNFPGYRKAREKGKAKFMPSSLRGQFIKVMWSDGFQDQVYKIGLFGRALLVQQQQYRCPTASEMNVLKSVFSPYVRAYTEYLIRCATKFTPQPNDLGDSECFLYLQCDRRFVSSDRRWVEIAKQACPGYYLDPEEQ
jgi:hypothetical protein